MRKSLRVLALVIALLLALSVFAGCKKEETTGSSSMMTQSEDEVSSSDETISGEIADIESGDKDTSSKKNNDKDVSSTKSKTQSKKTNSKTEIVVNKTGWPIVNKKITFEVMGVQLAGMSDFENMSMFKYYEAKTNVKVKFTAVAEGNINERKVLAIQSNDLPDMFALYGFTSAEMEQYAYGADPVLVDLMPYINDYAPNIAKELKVPITKALLVRDNTLYVIPGKTRVKTSYDHWLNINMDWLDNLGLDVPETTTEFLEVMRAFRDQDPNGNKQKDEIPFGQWNWNPDFILSMWGSAYAPGSGVDVDLNKKVYYPFTTGRARAACEYWSRFGSKKKDEGLTDRSVIGQGSGLYSKFTTLVKTGKVGCFVWSYFADSAFSDELVKPYQAIPFPTANYPDDGLKLPKASQPFTSIYGGGARAYITTACESVPAMLRYMDYFYTDEGILLGNYGSPDSGNYTKNSDGSYTINCTLLESYKHAVSWTMCLPEMTSFTGKIKSGSGTSGDSTATSYGAKANAVYRQAHLDNPQYRYMGFPKTSSELAKLRKYENAKLNDTSVLSNFVTGGQEMDEWVTFVQSKEAKGLKEYVAIYQKIADRNKQYFMTTGEQIKSAGM